MQGLTLCSLCASGRQGEGICIPPIFTRLVSHATRFAILGSPVLPTTVNTGKTSQLCLVGQTIVQYFVKPVVAITGGEGGIRTLGTGVSPYNGLANGSFSPPSLVIEHLQSDPMPRSRAQGLSFGSYCAPLCAPLVEARLDTLNVTSQGSCVIEYTTPAVPGIFDIAQKEET